MVKQSVEQKAINYLVDGKIGVALADENSAVLRAIGSAPEPYTIKFNVNTGWDCDCAAHLECAHIVAAKRILPHLVQTAEPVLGTPDDELTEFLNSFN